MKMTDKRYIESLKIRRAAIGDGIELVADDCNIIGMKHLTCTWGAHDGRDRRRHRCPFDMRKTGDLKHDYNGCFHTCRIFQEPKRKVDKHEAIKLYFEVINELEHLNAKPSVSR